MDMNFQVQTLFRDLCFLNVQFALVNFIFLGYKERLTLVSISNYCE